MLKPLDKTAVDVYNENYITHMDLKDYDWMDYTFNASLPFDNEIVCFSVNYFGTYTDVVKIKIVDYKGNITYECEHTIPCTLFKNFRKIYLEQHIASLHSEYAFCGDEITIDFYNEITKEINNGH
jgi:hypothetical protein